MGGGVRGDGRGLSGVPHGLLAIANLTTYASVGGVGNGGGPQRLIPPNDVRLAVQNVGLSVHQRQITGLSAAEWW